MERNELGREEVLVQEAATVATPVGMLNDLYMLVDRRVVKPTSAAQWCEWSSRPFEESRRVARTRVGKVCISTVFVGLDLGYPLNQDRPVVFETAVFGGRGAGRTARYATWSEAVAGHRSAVNRVRYENAQRRPVLRWLLAILKRRAR